MIRIGKPIVTRAGGKARITSVIGLDGKDYNLWFEVEDAYHEALCADRCDAFLAGLLMLAFRTRQDIVCEGPVTWQLLEGIERDFIDVLCQRQKELYRVRISAEGIEGIHKDSEVLGSGVSCGVDSLFTIKRRLLDCGQKRYLVLNNMTDDDGFRENRFSALVENAKSFAKEIGIPLIITDSNYTSGEIPGLTAESSSTWCILFSTFAMQNLFSRYYIASGGPVFDFTLYLKNGIFGTDCSNYDLLSLSAFSTPACKFIVDGLEDRVEKVREIVNWPPAWNHLDVCFRHADGRRGNGTYDCPKCMHTIAEILSNGGLDALEKFSNVFDVRYVKSHLEEYLADIIRMKLHGHEYGRELWAARKKVQYTKLQYLLACVIVIRKMARKILRGGARVAEFSPR